MKRFQVHMWMYKTEEWIWKNELWLLFFSKSVFIKLWNGEVIWCHPDIQSHNYPCAKSRNWLNWNLAIRWHGASLCSERGLLDGLTWFKFNSNFRWKAPPYDLPGCLLDRPDRSDQCHIYQICEGRCLPATDFNPLTYSRFLLRECAVCWIPCCMGELGRCPGLLSVGRLQAAHRGRVWEGSAWHGCTGLSVGEYLVAFPDIGDNQNNYVFFCSKWNDYSLPIKCGQVWKFVTSICKETGIRKLWYPQPSQNLGLPCSPERGRSGTHHAQAQPRKYCLYQALSGDYRRWTSYSGTALEPLTFPNS